MKMKNDSSNELSHNINRVFEFISLAFAINYSAEKFMTNWSSAVYCKPVNCFFLFIIKCKLIYVTICDQFINIMNY